MKNILQKITLLLAIFVTPTSLAYANEIANLNRKNTLDGFLNQMIAILDIAVELVIALSLVAFIWGIFSYVIAPSPEGKDKARTVIIWGLIGLFVMISVWSIIGLLTGTFFGGAPDTGPPELPKLEI